jgi:hypothetical protein
MKWGITVFSFVLVACTQSPQETQKEVGEISDIEIPLSLEDSLFIQQKLAELNREYFAERNDSMGGWEEGSVCYSADKELKIFSFKGEWVGAYPVPISLITTEDGKELGDYQYPITSIYKLTADKYLLIGNGSDRPRGLEYRMGSEANLYDKNTNKSTFITEAMLSMLVENTEGQAFTIEDPKIIYDVTSKILKSHGYSYDEDSWNNGTPKCYQIKKEYRFQENQFIVLKSDTLIEVRKDISGE